MASHKKQHFVPQSYLKAWCDPVTSAHQKRSVWRFDKDGSNPRRVAPKKIFYETDLYTIRLPNGRRDLVLEHGLASLEGAFVKIRDSTLAREREPTIEERVYLCAFIAAAHARTPTQRDHLGEQWGKVLEKMEHLKEIWFIHRYLLVSEGARGGSGRPDGGTMRKRRESRQVRFVGVCGPRDDRNLRSYKGPCRRPRAPSKRALEVLLLHLVIHEGTSNRFCGGCLELGASVRRACR